MNRRFNAFTLQQATAESPTLAHLSARVRDTSERLAVVRELIPPELRGAVQAGPVEGEVWCLLVRGNAAAAKLRQMLPALQGRLREKGWEAATIRLKIQTRR